MKLDYMLKFRHYSSYYNLHKSENQNDHLKRKKEKRKKKEKENFALPS
jgi:hypothetical protein